MDTPRGTVENAVRSPHRVRLLQKLSSNMQDFEELASNVEASNRTIKRAVKQMKNDGWIMEVDGKYQLTPSGELFAEYILSCIDETQMLLEFKPFFEHISSTNELVDIDLLVESDTEIITQQSGAPHAPIERTLKLLSETTVAYTLAPVITSVYAEQYYRNIVDDGMTAVTVLTPEVRDHMQNHGKSAIREVLGTGNVEIFIYESELPFGLLILKELVAVGAYDEYGTMRALVVSHSETVREWAYSTFEQYKQAAKKFQF